MLCVSLLDIGDHPKMLHPMQYVWNHKVLNDHASTVRAMFGMKPPYTVFHPDILAGGGGDVHVAISNPKGGNT